MAYAELGTMIPSSGAEYSYFMVAFGPFPAYMFSWVSTIIIKPSQLAIICLSFAEYVVEAFTEECAPSQNLLKFVGITTVGKIISMAFFQDFLSIFDVSFCSRGYLGQLFER